MQATGRRDTPGELALRSALHRLGLRFRVDCRPVPEIRRRADIVFRAAAVAVFMDGCFWHGCPMHGTWPTLNGAWWREKIEANRQRDTDTDRRLREAGWMAIRIWAHEDAAESARTIRKMVAARRLTERRP